MALSDNVIAVCCVCKQSQHSFRALVIRKAGRIYLRHIDEEDGDFGRTKRDSDRCLPDKKQKLREYDLDVHIFGVLNRVAGEGFEPPTYGL